MPETDSGIEDDEESMIDLDGATLILATSFGYCSPFVTDMCAGNIRM